MKLISLLVAVAIAFVLIACSTVTPSTSGSAAKAPEPNAAAVSEATAAVEASSGQSGDLLAGAQRNADGYIQVTADQLNGLLKNKQFALVNVHVPYEGELPATDLFIPFDQIQDHQSELPAKDAPIVLYCRSGRMSTMAAKTLAQLGYTNIYELNGGMNAWKAAGLALLEKGKQ